MEPRDKVRENAELAGCLRAADRCELGAWADLAFSNFHFVWGFLRLVLFQCGYILPLFLFWARVLVSKRRNFPLL